MVYSGREGMPSKVSSYSHGIDRGLRLRLDPGPGIIFKGHPRGLLPPARPLKVSQSSKHHHRLGTNYSKHEPMGDSATGCYHLCKNWRHGDWGDASVNETFTTRA